jgi:hypothetical protein
MRGRRRKPTHVQATSNTGTLQWLFRSVLSTSGHETRHLVLSELDLLAAERREADVGNLELLSSHCGLWGVVRWIEWEEM